MPSIVAHCMGIVVLVVLAAGPAPASDAYINDIAASAARIERGDYDAAVEHINSAFTKRSGEPLAHIALGIVFLHTRHTDRAYKEFNTARALDKDNALASYGLALYYLFTGKGDYARQNFYKASASGAYDTAPALAYLAALSGELPDVASATDPVLLQIEAQRHFKRREFKETRQILSKWTDGLRGFEEEIGSVVTFDRDKPLGMTGRGLSKPYKSLSEAEPGLKKVSGTITLRADLARTQGISFVLFYVDDNLIGMLNHPPYECDWDTTRYANSPHTVKIEGHDENGTVLSKKSVRVVVSNKVSETSGSAEGDDVARVERKLFDCLRLKPSRRLAYYTIAKCAGAEKDSAAALTAIERAVAIDPNYKDARNLLIDYYSPLQRYKEIRQGPTKDKLIAITFDDGPNLRTDKLLDVLAEKKVKATFFIVGSMAERNPEILKRMAAAGHEIQNHTYSHRNLEMLPDVEIERELIRTNAVIRGITGSSSRLFRLPGGHSNGKLSSVAGRYGLRPVFWTVNCSKVEGTTTETILSLIKSDASPGGIVLMHNVEDVTLLALPKALDDLKSRGYKFVTVSGLLASS